MDDNPIPPLDDKLTKYQWARVATMMKGEKQELKRRFLGELRRWSEQLERAHLLRDHIELPRPFPFREFVSKSDVEAKLLQRGKDPKLAEYVLSQRRKPTLLVALRPAAETLSQAWAAVLRRDSLLNHVRAVASFNAIVEPTVEGTAHAPDLLCSVLKGPSQVLRDGGTADAALFAERHILLVSQTLAHVAIPAAAASSTSSMMASEAAVKAGDQVRDLLWLAAVLKVVAWRCLWPQLGRADELVKVARLQTIPVIAEGLRMPISELGDLTDGSAAEVVGAIEKIDIRHETKGKPETTFTLRQPGSDAHAIATLPGFKGDATGAVPGAAVIMTGTWKSGDGRKPGHLRIGRDRIVGDRNKSFLQHLMWAARGVYVRIPHGLRIRCSWVVGYDGPLNPVRYGVMAQKE